MCASTTRRARRLRPAAGDDFVSKLISSASQYGLKQHKGAIEMTNYKTVVISIGLAVAVLAAAPAMAHHSFAMFDNQKTVVLDGTVKEFQWTNPHSWVQIMVKDPATGVETEWSVEGGSPNGLVRQGWKRTSLKPGDKAQITIHPLKDGSRGGSLVDASVGGVKIGG